jgi:hypothetical protein
LALDTGYAFVEGVKDLMAEDTIEEEEREELRRRGSGGGIFG